MKLFRRNRPVKIDPALMQGFEIGDEKYLLVATEYYHSDGSIMLTLMREEAVMERFKDVVDVVRELDMSELADAFRD